MEKLGIQQDVEAKERKELLHADTQRLFRESKDAAFKPIPVVHTPISSVLEKIRKRKLEVSKKTMMLSNNSSIHKISASREIMMEVEAKSTYSEEQRVDKLEIELKGKADLPSIDTGRTTDTSNTDEISVSPITRSSEIAPDEMVASIKVIRNKQTGFSGGYGFVEFNSHTAAEKALQKYSSMTMPDADRPFRLNWASFSTGDKRSNNGSDLSIFVGDLAADVTDTLLHETFSLKYPSVKAAKVVIDANTGRSRGYGFVRFGDDNERSQAMIEMNGVYCSSRPMCIGAATPRKSSGYQQHYSPQGGYSNSALAQGSQPDVDSTNTTIFVGVLDPNVSDEDLRQPFAQYGEIASVKIPVGKGCGFVQFANRNDAEKALQKLNGTAIGKQTVRLSWGRSPANKQEKMDADEIEEEEFGFSRNYFLAKEVCSSRKKSARKLSEIDLVDEEELREVAANIEPKHEKEVNDLINSYKNVYLEWLFALRCGFALLMYGFGSKKGLIEDFASRSLTEYSVVIVNGYLQSINLKQVVITLAELLWDQLRLRRKTTSGSLSKSQQPFNTRSIDDLLAFLDKPDLEDEECFVCIVVHNIDGPGVRDSDSQQCLARIAACSHVHMVASIDHVNAPLLWDKKMVHTQFNWYWCHVPTFAPYKVEATFFPFILAHGGTAQSVKTASIVLQSLIPNAQNVFKVLAEHQLAHPDEEGMPINNLYTTCREQFLVSSQVTLNSHLTEFKDHELIKIRRNSDGQDCLHIPLTNEALQKLIAEIIQ